MFNNQCQSHTCIKVTFEGQNQYSLFGDKYHVFEKKREREREREQRKRLSKEYGLPQE